MAEGDKRVEYTVPSSHWDYMKTRGLPVAVNNLLAGIAPWTWEAVASRLKEAAQTVRAMPRDRPAGYKVQWPHVPHDRMDAWLSWGTYGDPDRKYSDERRRPDLRFTPETGAIDRMDEAFAWLGYLTVEQRKVVQAVASGIRIVKIARKLKVQPITIRRQFRRGCQIIAEKLNG